MSNVVIFGVGVEISGTRAQRVIPLCCGMREVLGNHDIIQTYIRYMGGITNL